MKIKIIFSFLSMTFFGLGILFVFMSGHSGEVLGDTTSGTSDNTLTGTTTIVLPIFPPSLQAFVYGPSTVKLNWSRPENASGAVVYKITRNGAAIKTFTDTYSYENTGLNPGSEYKYSVWAQDSIGRSVRSSDIEVKLPLTDTVVETAATATATAGAEGSNQISTGSESASLSTATSGLKTSYPIADRPTKDVVSVKNTTASSGTDSTSQTQPPVGIQPKTVSNKASGTPSQEQQEIREPGIPVVTLSDRDTDEDGLSDAEEIRLGTSSFNPDTDGDGFSDFEEVRNGFNPLKSAASDRGDKVIFESPKEKRISKSAVEDSRLRIEKVERVTGTDGKPTTRISGKGTPNALLTLYIYSDPIVVTVRTDGNGNWSYELDRDLDDGKHEVYAAVTDATGRISSQSNPIPFVKTAEAVSVVQASDLDQEVRGNQSPIERAGGQFAFFGIAIVIMFLLGAFYFIGHRAFSE
jgi:hypothetical protein